MIRVVIADDEEKICWLMQEIIEWDRLGAELIGMVGDGLKALELVCSQRPDVLITDIRMPELDGLELIERVAQNSPETSIIVISGYQQFEYARTAIRFGVRDYLLKPLNAQELNHALEKIGEQKNARIAQRSEQSQLHSELERLRDRERQELLLSLLQGDDITQNIKELNARYHLSLQDGVYRGMAVKVDIAYQRVEDVSAGFVLEHIQDLARTILSPVSCEALYAIEGETNTLLMLLNRREELDSSELYTKLYLAWNQYVRSFDCYTLSVGLSDVFPAEHMADAMTQAKDLLEARILCGSNRLITVQRSTNGIAERFSVNEKTMFELQNSVSLLQIESSKEIIRSTFSALQENVREDYHVYWELANRMVRVIVKAFESVAPEMETTERMENVEYFHLYLSNVSNALEMGECLAFAAERLLKRYQQKKQQQDSQPIRAAKEYVSTHLSEALTLSEIAAHAGLSSAYFSVLFKQSTGENLKDYITACRMERAKKLLRTTNDTVFAVAQQVGYTDKRYFSQQFEKNVGLKPAKYRKLYS